MRVRSDPKTWPAEAQRIAADRLMRQATFAHRVRSQSLIPNP